MPDDSRLKLILDLTEEMLAAINAWSVLHPGIADRETAALRLLEMALEEAALAAAQTPGEP